MPLVQTRGAASAQGFGEFAQQAATAVNYIEEVFSTFLYTGTGSSQTITNSIDLSTNGGLTWIKGRSGTTGNRLTDTARGATLALVSDTTAGEATQGSGLSAFGTTGFTIGSNASYNTSAATYVSWTFRKQPKFFDVVTYTGTGSATMINHNLGSVPGMIIYKNLNIANNWCVYHRSISPTKALFLNLTSAAGTSSAYFGNQTATSTQFPIGDNDLTNAGDPYVAYLFAHDAGGFGLTGLDNVISCGGFTTSSYYATVNLGYEPQFVLTKRTDSSVDGGWFIADTMRGLTANANATFANLFANTDAAESQNGNIELTSTGFVFGGAATGTYIYMAIRRGPMRVPTDPTKVFAMATAVGTNPAFVSNAVVDMGLNVDKTAASIFFNQSRLVGDKYLNTRATAAEVSGGGSRSFDYMNGMINGQSPTVNNVGYMFGRASGFFDEVCYTGAGNGTTVSHNLGVEPELAIIKQRSGANDWIVRAPGTGADRYLLLNKTNAQANASGWYSATSSQITFTTAYGTTAGSGSTYVGYLFATCAGVSKVGSYTGNGSTQTINCGFGAGGTRFVIIRCTDTISDWYVYDTLRGMTVLTDPYLFTNAPAAAEVATLGSVTTVSTGFAVNESILAGINTSATNYIFLAIA